MVKNRFRMIFRFFILGFFTNLILNIHAQAQQIKAEGKISYFSHENVYVKFFSTEHIQTGDTLYYKIADQTIPAIIILQKSSISCVGKPLDSIPLKLGEVLFKLEPRQAVQAVTKEIESSESETGIVPTVRELEFVDSIKISKPTRWTGKENINGRFSVSTNGDLQTEADRFARLRVSSSFNIDQIRGSRVSLQSYLTYRHRYGVDQDQSGFLNDFKIFTLAMAYAINQKDRIWLGRRINPLIANMGALDGIQYEKFYKSLSLGILAGFRPDVLDYGLDVKSPQYGAYLSHQVQSRHGQTQSSVAFVEQTLSANTDRRFIYFQHNSYPLKNLNLFFSAETDLFQNIRDSINHRPRLTSLYTNLRYRINRKMNFQISYDNRRNVIYYESYRNTIDQLLAQETRQGFRLMYSYNPLRLLSLSWSSFLRFQGNGNRPTINHSASLYCNRIPLLKTTLSLQFNTFETDYIQSYIYSIRLNRDFFNSRMNAELSGRINEYHYTGSEQSFKQQIVGAGVSILLTKFTSAILNYEASFGKNLGYHRYFITMQHRIRSKKK